MAAAAGNDWISAGGGLTDDRYSTLNQINTTNVSQLTQAWHIHLGIGKATQKKLSEEGSIISYQGVLYATDGDSTVYALDGTTGARLWTYKPGFSHKVSFGLFVNRGLGMGGGNVYEGILDGSVVAINQVTGKPVWRPSGQLGPGVLVHRGPRLLQRHVDHRRFRWYAGARGYAIALDATTGSRGKRYVTPAPVHRVEHVAEEQRVEARRRALDLPVDRHESRPGLHRDRQPRSVEHPWPWAPICTQTRSWR